MAKFGRKHESHRFSRFGWGKTITAVLFFIGLFTYLDRTASHMFPTKASAAEEKDSLPEQVKELQKQVSALQARFDGPRVIAAGTATWTLPASQKNDTSTRVKLPPDIVSGLGKDYIVLLTNRFPGGFPYFDPYWRPATDGFDIILVDSSVSETMSASYGARKRTYLVDWIVVKK